MRGWYWAPWFILLGSATLVAQTGAPATASADATAEFRRLLAEFKLAGARLSEWSRRFATSREEDRERYRSRHNTLKQQAEELFPKLVAAAEAAYRAKPNQDQEVTAFLRATTSFLLSQDRYEEASRLAGLLIELGPPDTKVYETAGVAAFAMHDFDAAVRLLQRGEETGDLGFVSQRTLTDAPACRDLWKAEQEIRSREAAADDLPRVLFRTTQGDIIVELFENEAPGTVGNFINLVEKQFYNGLTFHRVVGGYLAQTGCPKGDGTGGPDYRIPSECYSANHRNHFRGSLSMANEGPHQGGSQFFITFRPTMNLNGKHTVFGRVIEGIEVLAKLDRREPNRADIAPADQILEATVLRKRAHPYQPQTTKELADAKWREGHPLEEAGKVDEAAKVYQQGLEIDPDHFALNFFFGRRLTDEKKFAEAIEYFSRGLRGEPNNALGHFALGVAQIQLERYDDAEASFRESIRHNPNFAPAYNNLSLMLLRKRKFDEALDNAERAAHLNPKDPTTQKVLEQARKYATKR